ncbi:MAG: ADP-ribosylglycohydrolase family protein [Kiritimatiellaeota bacterium]|nr:ADP-ribosylglycohydrolase family protein [Kiritimatiellota bacterium]
MTERAHYRGALLGLAVGDALGTAVEFKPRGSFSPVKDITGGGPFDLNPGQWTDDTSMALCLAESLVECRGFDPADQMDRYVHWYREGHLSSTGECFDIGNATRTALEKFRQTQEPFSGSTDPRSAGNGSLMRLAPVPLFFANDPAQAIERAGESSRTTHATITCIDACRFMGGLIVGAVCGTTKKELLAMAYCPVPGYWQQHPLTPEVAAVAQGSFKQKEPPAIKGSGYVVRSLEAALWAFHKSATFEEGALLAVNLGDDADTTGAIYGQLAGAFYGFDGIPAHWRNVIAQADMIQNFADRLYAEAQAVKE